MVTRENNSSHRRSTESKKWHKVQRRMFAGGGGEGVGFLMNSEGISGGREGGEVRYES